MAEDLIQTRTFTVARDTRSLPDGRTVEKTLVRHPGGVVVLPFLDDDTIIMVRNYRVTLNDWLWELPAGTLEPPEQPRDCALRELREETGYCADRIEPFLEMHTAPGFCDELLWTFVARDLRHVGQDLRSDELMTVEPIRLAEAVDRAWRGGFKDAKTIATVCAWALRARQGHS